MTALTEHSKQRRKDYHKQRRQYAKANGICQMCFVAKATHKTLCEPCSQRNRNKSNEYYHSIRKHTRHEIREKDGKCHICESRQAQPGKTVCRDCVYARHGLTSAQVDTMLEAQSHKCKMCGCTPEKFVVDHCHKTFKVRGMICYRCNTYLGYIERGPIDLYQLAQEYLNVT